MTAENAQPERKRRAVVSKYKDAFEKRFGQAATKNAQASAPAAPKMTILPVATRPPRRS